MLQAFHPESHTPLIDTVFQQQARRVALLDRMGYRIGMNGVDPTNPATDLTLAGSLTATTASVLLATGAAATGGTIAAISTLAGPIGAAAGALVGIFMQVIADSGCGQTCIISSDYANKVTAALQQLVQAYQSSGHTKSEQTATLNAIDYAFAQLNQLCGNPQLGNAGKRCISERLVRGGTAPWCPLPGHTGCDYYTAYRDPVANDPNVVPDTPASSGIASAVNSVLSSAASPAGLDSLLSGNGLIIAALIVGALVLSA
jgi:hypothetical protein